MSKVVVSRRVSKLIRAKRTCRNNVLPNHHTPRRTASAYNLALAKARKLIFCKAVPIDQSTNPPAGATQVVWGFYHHTGFENSGKLKAKIVAVAEGLCKILVTVGAETVTLESPAADDVRRIQVMRAELDLPENTTIEGSVQVYDNYRLPASITIWEAHDEAIDFTDDASCDVRAFRNKGNIYDSDHQSLAQNIHNTYLKGGKTLLTLSPDLYANFWTSTSATEVNMLDMSSTSVTASTPGYNFYLTNLPRVHETTVRCRFAAYGFKSGGSSTGNLTLQDSSGTVASLDMLTGTADWIVDNDCYLTPGNKYDLFIKADGSETVTIRYVSLCLLDSSS